MIKWCNTNTAKTHYPTPEEHNQAAKDFNNMFGGYNIFILNHVKRGEKKYNITHTDKGIIFQTDNKEAFIKYIAEM